MWWSVNSDQWSVWGGVIEVIEVISVSGLVELGVIEVIEVIEVISVSELVELGVIEVIEGVSIPNSESRIPNHALILMVTALL